MFLCVTEPKMHVREPVGLAKVNCQGLTVYEWSCLGDAGRPTTTHGGFNEWLPSEAERVKTAWLDLETKG